MHFNKLLDVPKRLQAINILPKMYETTRVLILSATLYFYFLFVNRINENGISASK